jgi:hypothetical protein
MTGWRIWGYCRKNCEWLEIAGGATDAAAPSVTVRHVGCGFSPWVSTRFIGMSSIGEHRRHEEYMRNAIASI